MNAPNDDLPGLNLDKLIQDWSQTKALFCAHCGYRFETGEKVIRIYRVRDGVWKQVAFHPPCHAKRLPPKP